MKKVTEVYQNARPFSAVAKEVQGVLSENGIAAKDCVVAASVCSDEVNNSYVDALGAGGSFFLGGLAGLPHTGVTGMIAFSHHIADNGAAIILYGPHIGIDDAGTVGNVLRSGQGKSSNCCGALKLGLSRLNNNESLEVASEEDIQQYYLEQLLQKNKSDLPNDRDQLMKATALTFKAIETKIDKLVSQVRGEFHGKGILLVGGTLINTDTEKEDYFDLKTIKYLG